MLTRRLMRKFFGVLVAACFMVPMMSHAQGVRSVLKNLTYIRHDVESKRISSFDSTGGNADWFGPIPAGESRTIFKVEGAGIINHIWITIAPPPGRLPRNDIILRMWWDGEEHPSVEAPIGPFFGQGWELSYEFKSLPLAVAPRGGRALVSYFQMPFSDGARITIENQTGRKIIKFYYYIDYVKMDSLPEKMGRFHAWYNRELMEASPKGENIWRSLGQPYGNNTTGNRNYVIADIEGTGHFVGVNYYVQSPTPMWYGEGDDMIFIDGEQWPSTLHGTGTEDYFNTAFVPKEEYRHPFFGIAYSNYSVGWLGRTHYYRFHITDPIYFDKSFKFTIEHGHNNVLTLDVRSVAYWYQEEPHKPFPPLPTEDERDPMPKIRPIDIHRWRDAWRRLKGDETDLWGTEPLPKRQEYEQQNKHKQVNQK